MGDVAKKTVKNGSDNPSWYLQKIFDNKGINLNVQNDQKQYQIWHSQKQEVSFSVEVLAAHPDSAALASVFGYYTNGNTSNFVPVLRRGDVASFGSVAALPYGQSLAFKIEGASTTAFAIKTSDGNTWYTNNSKNQNHNDQVIVYEVSSNVYIIAFEDLSIDSSDQDYNDLVIKLTVTGCEDPTPNPVPSVTLNANPQSINKGDSSTLTWNSQNVTACAAPWTSATSTSGSQNVSPASTTEYSIACTGPNGTAYATTTVTVSTGPGPGNQCLITVVSDTTNLVGTDNAVATYNQNPRWTASIPGATWIWSTFFVENPTQENIKTFTKTFNINSISDVDSAQLIVAADNSYTVSINGNQVGADSGEFNYFDGNKDAYNVAAYLVTGSNTISFTVKNWALNGGTVESNPAGLLYKLTIKSDDPNCNVTPVVPTVDLDANPSTITEGENSTLSWTSTNATSCAAPWTMSTSTSGSWSVSPSTTTNYAISCTGVGGTVHATTTVNVTKVPTPNPVPSVTLNANPQSINKGDSSTLTWNSQNVTACAAPWTSATSTSGSQVVSPDSTSDYAITCTGSYGTVHATTTVTIKTSTGGGGGGGGSSGGGGGGISGRRRDITNLLAPQGEVLGVTSCAYLRDYMRIDWKNDPIEVLKLQSFLNVFEGENLSYTTVFDQPTFQATERFQNKYFGDILEPWGHTAPTGFVYILTKKKVNEIYCNTVIPLTVDQQNEIREFRAFITGIYGEEIANYVTAGYGIGYSVSNGSINDKATSTGPVIVDLGTTEGGEISLQDSEGSVVGNFIQNATVAALSFPGKISVGSRYLIITLILIALALVAARMFSSNENMHVAEATYGNKKDEENPAVVSPSKSEADELPEEEIVIDDFEEEETK